MRDHQRRRYDGAHAGTGSRSQRQFDLKLITVADLIRLSPPHRAADRKRVATTRLPTAHFGEFTVHAYEASVAPYQAVAFVRGDVADGEPTLVRVHSSCVTGDLLDSLRCDCGSQLHHALQQIDEAGKGALIYLEQEGRGIRPGAGKLKAYALQDDGAALRLLAANCTTRCSRSTKPARRADLSGAGGAASA